jgi:hypothetical protein
MQQAGVYNLTVDSCVYQGSSGLVYVNATQFMGNISNANLTINFSFGAGASPSLILWIKNSSGSFVSFNSITDSSFNWTNSTTLEFLVNYTVSPGYDKKFNVTANITGNFFGIDTSLKSELDPVISCNPPASGNWIVENSSWLICEGQTFNFNNTLYVRDFSNATFNNTVWMTDSWSTFAGIISFNNSNVIIDTSSLNQTSIQAFNSSRVTLLSSSLSDLDILQNASATLNSVTVGVVGLIAEGVTAPSAIIAGTSIYRLNLISDVAVPSVQFGSQNTTLTHTLELAFSNTSAPLTPTMIDYTGPFVINDTTINSSNYRISHFYINLFL